MGRFSVQAAFAVTVALGIGCEPASAQSNPQFIRFQGASSGALYRPDSGPAPRVGIVVMHRTSNYMTHPACTELSRRGFMMLCMTTSFANNEVFVDYEKLPLDVKNGVAYLRKQAGITKVLVPGDLTPCRNPRYWPLPRWLRLHSASPPTSPPRKAGRNSCLSRSHQGRAL